MSEEGWKRGRCKLYWYETEASDIGWGSQLVERERVGKGRKESQKERPNEVGEREEGGRETEEGDGERGMVGEVEGPK
ncbi:hypothetical protein AMTR_s00021p00102690 [Amborella trichopoda]|uniref:Uncharacterized protein n=1 Tax=Amborella trichopoda TaxID=13333 RepID=W1Q0Z0_AMBTC|nr:hypothetical protein AMTR_s00021p00102690 [Amborella trichopoda]